MILNQEYLGIICIDVNDSMYVDYCLYSVCKSLYNIVYIYYINVIKFDHDKAIDNDL